MKTLSRKPSSISSFARSPSSIVTTATAQTDVTTLDVIKTATPPNFSLSSSDPEDFNNDDICSSFVSSSTTSRLSSFLTPSASLTNTEPIPNPRKQKKKQEQSKKNNQTITKKKTLTNNYSAYNQNQTTKPFVVPESFQFEAKDKHEAKMVETSLSFAASATDFAYLHIEAINSSKLQQQQISSTSDKYHSSTFELDMICWKIILKKALSTYLGISGDAIPTDILHIINPSSWALQKYKQRKSIIISSGGNRHFSTWDSHCNNNSNNRNTRYSARARRNRRYLSSTGSESSLSDSAESIFSVSSYTKRFFSSTGEAASSYSQQQQPNNALINSSKNRKQYEDENDDMMEEYDPSIVRNPQVWIRIPEQELTKVWMALSGFSTSIDTGNYGNVNIGVRVIRASKYINSTTGTYRNKW